MGIERLLAYAELVGEPVHGQRVVAMGEKLLARGLEDPAGGRVWDL